MLNLSEQVINYLPKTRQVPYCQRSQNQLSEITKRQNKKLHFV